MKTPIAVLTSDVHYNLQTLELAKKSVEIAMDKASELDVPFIVAGDLHDTKAMLRAECVSSLIQTFKREDIVKIVLIGNHDLVNHHDGSRHSLEFLRPYCQIVDIPVVTDKFALIPYQVSNEAFRDTLRVINTTNKIIIAHQGIQGAYMGEYIKDESSVSPEELPDLRFISGHYHRKQDVELPNGGLWSYIGNPYGLSFAEANDGPKGFCVLYSDGTLEQVSTGLRRHVVIDCEYRELTWLDKQELAPDDLVWLKVRGAASELIKLNKVELGERFLGHSNFRFEPILIESDKQETIPEKLSSDQVFDTFIDRMNETDKQKEYLKKLWRELV